MSPEVPRCCKNVPVFLFADIFIAMNTLSGSTYHVYFVTFEFCRGNWILIAADRYI